MYLFNKINFNLKNKNFQSVRAPERMRVTYSMEHT